MTRSSPHTVTVDDPERANLLELMLANLLRRRLTDPGVVAHARALDEPIIIEAGTMRATLIFGDHAVTITRAAPSSGGVHVRGSLTAIVDAALGRRRVVHALHGELRASGRPRALWHALALLHAEGAR